jgi:hypothetical protein
MALCTFYFCFPILTVLAKISSLDSGGYTDIYYIPPFRWIAVGIKICAVSNFINTGKIFGEGVI